MTRALAGIVALVAFAVIALGSQRGLTTGDGVAATLRVSWSARPERVETCRRLSDAELAERPQHMRRALECEGTTARYFLEVRRDGERIDTATLRGGGLRNDRELYALRELTIPPGRARIEVRFARLDSSSRGDDDDDRRRERTREDDERDRRHAEAIPPLLVLDSVVTSRAGEVVLVTYDAARRALVMIQRDERPGIGNPR
jgi:hypothetical protein